MAKFISVRNKKGNLWNLPTVLGDWYCVVISKGVWVCGKLCTLGNGQFIKVGEHSFQLDKIKAWCRKDGDLNNELVPPEDYVIVDEFLREY